MPWIGVFKYVCCVTRAGSSLHRLVNVRWPALAISWSDHFTIQAQLYTSLPPMPALISYLSTCCVYCQTFHMSPFAEPKLSSCYYMENCASANVKDLLLTRATPLSFKYTAIGHLTWAWHINNRIPALLLTKNHSWIHCILFSFIFFPILWCWAKWQLNVLYKYRNKFFMLSYGKFIHTAAVRFQWPCTFKLTTLFVWCTYALIQLAAGISQPRQGQCKDFQL